MLAWSRRHGPRPRDGFDGCGLDGDSAGASAGGTAVSAARGRRRGAAAVGGAGRHVAGPRRLRQRNLLLRLLLGALRRQSGCSPPTCRTRSPRPGGCSSAPLRPARTASGRRGAGRRPRWPRVSASTTACGRPSDRPAVFTCLSFSSASSYRPAFRSAMPSLHQLGRCSWAVAAASWAAAVTASSAPWASACASASSTAPIDASVCSASAICETSSVGRGVTLRRPVARFGVSLGGGGGGQAAQHHQRRRHRGGQTQRGELPAAVPGSCRRRFVCC